MHMHIAYICVCYIKYIKYVKINSKWLTFEEYFICLILFRKQNYSK